MTRFPAVIYALFLWAATAFLAHGQTSGFQILRQFDESDIGTLNSRLVEGVDGNFYGTSLAAVYRITPAGEVTVLYRFPDGPLAYPLGLVAGQDGQFYGTTSFDGAHGLGTIFSITTDGDFTVLYDFALETGGTPRAFIQARNGSFYGITSFGGSHDAGTIWSFSPATGVFTVLVHLTGAPPAGQNTLLGLVEGPDGDFYLTDATASPNPTGAILRLSPTGELTTFFRFGEDHPGDGLGPAAELLPGRNGRFYGTTTAGGAHGQGTLFALTSDGALTTLHDFSDAAHEGTLPGRLLQTGDGNLYGETVTGGAAGYEGGYSGNGTVFVYTADGKFYTLHHFTGGAGGLFPACGLTLGTDGNLYGLLGDYDPDDAGKIFRLPLPAALPPPLALFLGTPVAAVSTGGGTPPVGEFALSLSVPAPRKVVVSYRMKGTAVNGVDYAFLKGKATIKAGAVTKSIKVQPLLRLLHRDKKTVKLIVQPGADFVLEGAPFSKVTISARSPD